MSSSLAQMLRTLARQSAAAWNAMATQAFQGVATVETANTVYRFENGLFMARAQKPSSSFGTPSAMRGVRLVGFLAYERGLWSLSPRWRERAIGLLWRPNGYDERSFILTSPTMAWAIEAPVSEVVLRRDGSPPPNIHRPAPASVTRLLPATAALAGDLR
jgi:hypothetical protein